MKILFVTQNLAPFRIAWLDALAAHSGAKITVMHLGQYEKITQSAYKNVSAKNVKIEHAGRQFGRIWLYRYKKVFAAAAAADIVIVDGYGFLAQILLIFGFRLRKQAFVLSADGGISPETEPLFKRKLKTWLISSAYAYLSTCPEMDAILKNYGAKEKVIYRHRFSSVQSNDIITEIPNAVQRKQKKGPLGIKAEYLILSVGKDPQGKGFDTLLKSMSALNKDDVQCCIVGAQGIEKLAASVAPDISSKIMCIPYLDKKGLADYYEACDLFVLPTRHDVWGLVIGEAMAKGAPVITTLQCVAGVNMLGQEQLIDAEDIEGLTAKMYFLLTHEEERQKMAQEQLDTIKRYAYDQAAKEDWANLKTFYKSTRV